MASRSNFLFPNLKVGASVVVSVSEFDRGPLDDNNIPELITEVKNDKYKVATAAGILKHLVSRNALQEVSSFTLKIGDVPLDKVVSLREAAAVHSLYNGQGFVKCNCAKSKSQCATRRCTCFKNNVKCNSRCHGSVNCSNK